MIDSGRGMKGEAGVVSRCRRCSAAMRRQQPLPPTHLVLCHGGTSGEDGPERRSGERRAPRRRTKTNAQWKRERVEWQERGIEERGTCLRRAARDVVAAPLLPLLRLLHPRRCHLLSSLPATPGSCAQRCRPLACVHRRPAHQSDSHLCRRSPSRFSPQGRFRLLDCATLTTQAAACCGRGSREREEGGKGEVFTDAGKRQQQQQQKTLTCVQVKAR